MSGAYGFSAADSVTGAIYQWTLGTIDFSGAGYPGPNSPVNQRLVATSNQGPAGAPGAAGSAIPAPSLVATSNIGLTGIVTVDGIASNTVTGDILTTAQTTTSQNGYWTPNAGGAWTRPSYYSSDAMVASVNGIASGAALAGFLNKGQTYYQFSGTAIAGGKVWVPSKAPPVIFANEAPWNLRGDASDEAVGLAAVFAYAGTLLGAKIAFAKGVYRTSQSIIKARYVSVEGAGRQATEIGTYGSTIKDTLVLSEMLNEGGGDHAKISHIKISNNLGASGAPIRASSTAYSVGQRVRTAIPGTQILECTTAGTTGAHPPIGSLCPFSPFMVLTGQSNADKQPILVVRTGGYFGAMTYQLSTDYGATLDSTVHTTQLKNSDGTFRDFETATFPSSGTLGVKLAARTALDFVIYDANTLAVSFTQPAVGSNVQIQIVGGGANTSRLTGTGFCYINGGGLYSLVSIDSALLATVKLVTAIASPGATVAASWVGQAWIPTPRIEVIGTPPADNWAFDVYAFQPIGKLGSAVFRYSSRAIAPQDRGKPTSMVLEAPTITTATGAYYDYADPVSGCTVRFHTGVYINSASSFNYFTPDPVCSVVPGTTIQDGSVVWTVYDGPEAIRSNGRGFLTLDDVWLEGGMCGIRMSQAEQVTIHDTIFDGYLYCGGYGTNGDGRLGEIGGFTNNISYSGNCVWYSSGGYGLVHEGCNSLSVAGTCNFQYCPLGFMRLAVIAGGKASGFYVESSGPCIVRTTNAVSRQPVPFGLHGFAFSGFFTGSVQGPCAFDLWYSDGISWVGGQFGGSSYGVQNALYTANGHIEGCQHINGLPLTDSPFTTGTFVDQGYENAAVIHVDTPYTIIVANGVNDLSTQILTDQDLTGPTAAFSIRSMPAGKHGQRVRFRYTGPYDLTLSHEAGAATAANRLKLPNGADMTLSATGGHVQFDATYRAGSINRWIVDAAPRVNGIRSFAGTTDTVLAADLQGEVESSGGSAVTVTVGVQAKGFVVTYAQVGAGALSFTASGVTLETALAGSGATTVQHQTRTLFWRTATNVRIT